MGHKELPVPARRYYRAADGAFRGEGAQGHRAVQAAIP